MRILPKIILSFLVLGIVPAVSIAGINYVTAKSAITDQVLSTLDLIASARKASAEAFITDATSRQQVMSSRQGLREDFENYNTTKNKFASDSLNQQLIGARTSADEFEEIYLVDESGVVVASSDTSHVGAVAKNEDYFTQALKKQYFNVHASSDGSLQRFITSGPLYSVESPDKFLGVLVVEENTRALNAIVSNYDGLGTTGEVLLALRDKNGDALFITNTRHDTNAAFKRIEGRDNPRLMMNIALDKQEVLKTDAVNYLGNPIIGVSRYIDGVDWGLTVNIESNEALASVNKLLIVSLFVLGAALIVLILAGLIIGRLLTRPLVRLTDVVNEISRGKLDVKLGQLDTPDEIGDLARAFERVIVSLKLAMRGTTSEPIIQDNSPTK